MRYYIIAGEASGDLHASNLVKAIKEEDPQAEFRGWGGDLMQGAGVTLVKHIKELAFMGFVEVLMNLRTILGNMKMCKADILEYQPDVVILVDYPGFNLRIAEFLKEKNIRNFYYISPQVWAWKQSRVHKIKRIVDAMFVILPFEEEFYNRFDYPVHFVGHPLLDAVSGHSSVSKETHSKPVIALLPGSRKQEIGKMLPLMLEVVPAYPDYDFVVAGSPNFNAEFYARFIGELSVSIRINQTYDLLGEAHAALVTSGTATLETALFEVPQVVCYKANSISYFIARMLIKVKYISLVNLIFDQELVKELIQGDLNKRKLCQELDSILEGKERKQLQAGYIELKKKLGGPGASKRTAQKMLELLK